VVVVMVGVNLAGGEFGDVPGTYGRDYTYPGEKQFAYLASKGFPVARVPIRWERIQRKLLGPLDERVIADIRECALFNDIVVLITHQDDVSAPVLGLGKPRSNLKHP